MELKMVRRCCYGLALFFCTSSVWAQNNKWAEDMFDKLEHDFGVVARGADTKYRITFTNKYADPVHISDIRKSCGCTSATPSKMTLASREKGYVEFEMDTKKFTHQKDSSVTIVFDKPLYAEVRIPVKAFIRTDVVLTPGGAEFGPIVRGTDAERKIAIAYAGVDSWTIKNVVSKNPNITAKAVETARGGGRVKFDLAITVKGDIPLGDFRDQVILVTSDAGNPYIPVLIDGKAENEYSVSPDLVDFGTMAPGVKKTMNVIVRGRKPFTIDKIESEKSAGTFEVALPAQARPIHVLPLTMIAPSEAGALTEEFTITINGSSQPVIFKAHGKVAPGPTTGATASGGNVPTTAQTTNP
jgi:Protein of unknown function (DUF1573)